MRVHPTCESVPPFHSIADFFSRPSASYTHTRTPARTPPHPRRFTDYYASESSPQQLNGYDCGVFVCATLEQLSRRDPRFAFEEDPVLEPPSSEDEDLSESESESEVGAGYAGDGRFVMKREGAGAGGGAPRKLKLPRRGLDGYEWNFSQGDMPYLRRRIICEVAGKRLLD